METEDKREFISYEEYDNTKETEPDLYIQVGDNNPVMIARQLLGKTGLYDCVEAARRAIAEHNKYSYNNSSFKFLIKNIK